MSEAELLQIVFLAKLGHKFEYTWNHTEYWRPLSHTFAIDLVNERVYIMEEASLKILFDNYDRRYDEFYIRLKPND